MFGESSIEQIITTLGYAGIFGLMISNGFWSFPSSQILYILTGYFIFTGDLNVFLVAGIGALGNTIGNTLLFHLTKTRGLAYISKKTLLPQTEILKVQVAFEKRGWWMLFVGKLLPAIKVFMPIVAGIARMPVSVFLPIIFVSSVIWSLMFIAIGFYFGKSADVFGPYALILGIFALALAFYFYRYMNGKDVMRRITSREDI